MAEKSKRGCLFYGCLTSILVFLGVVIGLYFGVRKAMNTLVTEYTSNKPAAIPQVTLSDSEMQQLESRIEKYSTNKSKAEPLELTPQEVNALMAKAPQLQNFKGKFFFEIETNNVKAQVALPLSEFKVKQFADRYLNGTATLDLSITNGELVAHVKEMEINGKKLPSSLMTNLRAQNIAEDINKKPETRSELSKIDSLEIKDGKVYVRFK